MVIHHTFSSKPLEGYSDYYDKMTTYERIISGHAEAINPNVTARTFAIREEQDEDSVFKYMDTASTRAGIGAVTEKLKIRAVAIVGLGGTGSYILDLLAKTPVKEIHLFDGDKLGQHNAFRAPGAPSIEILKTTPLKAKHYADIYAKMRHNIFDHGHVDPSTVNLLKDMDFVFVAVDKGHERKFVVEKLEEFNLPFIDVGMDLNEVNGSLSGLLRVSFSTNETREKIHSTIPFQHGDDENDYTRNIQIAELNALSATLAVIKWKKSLGFYHDLEKEHSSIYGIDGNTLINEDKA